MPIKPPAHRRSKNLRVPEDLHRRLTARAARERRSFDAVVTEILDATADADIGDRRAQVRAAAVIACLDASVLARAYLVTTRVTSRQPRCWPTLRLPPEPVRVGRVGWRRAGRP